MAQQVQLQETGQKARLRIVSSAPPARLPRLEDRAKELRRTVIRAD